MKNYKNLTKNNDGFTLVELIIVLAIVAVLSAMSLISITLINSAKAKEASVTFDSEVATLITKSKNMACSYDADDDGVDEDYPDYRHCLWIYRKDGTYYVKQGYYDTTKSFTDTGAFIFSNTDSSNGGMGKSLSSYVSVQRVNGSTTTAIGDEGMYIVYDKAGNCIYGTGEYQFLKRNSNLVATVTLRKNGSHELR